MKQPKDFLPIAEDTRSTVDTNTAAYHLNRQPQTLRMWACRKDGPLQPRRVNGRLAWPMKDIKRLMGHEP